MTESSTAVRSARASRGFTQQQLADLTDVDQARISRIENGRDADFSTVQRVLAGAGHRLYALPLQRDDAAAAAVEIRGRLRVGDRDRALRALLQLNDNLVAEHGLLRGVLGLAEPEPTRNRAWDAAIAALVAWRLGEEGLPLPAWVTRPMRYLPVAVVLEIDPADPAPPESEVPEEFLRRGVHVWRDTFASV